MFIISQTSVSLINPNNVTVIYSTQQGYQLKAKFKGNDGCLLASFDNHDGNKEHWHHATGKKLKRHGGSKRCGI